MKNKLIISICLLFSISSFSQAVADKILYGVIRKENMVDSPYAKWFVTNYDNYQPAAGTVAALQKLPVKDISIDIYLGTWCGDSRREVPRFLKLLDQIPVLSKNVKIIGLGGSDSLYKQSPGKEESGKGIFRVPVFIIYRNGVEVNRINEFPAVSLEKDLYAILNGNSYTPNYRSFATIRNWMADGTLLDKNSSVSGLATQIKTLVSTEYELNSLGHLFIKQGRNDEALKIFQLNARLYPESANVLSSLGEGYHKTGDDKTAALCLERSLELNKDPLLVKEILKVLYAVKGVK
jgi:tetratricopeptide (TPR) repeat protein